MSDLFTSQVEIQYPVRIERDDSVDYGSYILRGANDYPLACNMASCHAEEIARILNAQSVSTPRKSRKQKIEEELRASDLMAQETGRTDIIYGHHDSLPRGEHVARIGKK